MPHFPHFLHFSVYILSPPHLSSKLVSFLFLFSSISLPLPSTSISLPCSCSTLVSPCPFLFCRGSLFLALSVYLFLFHSRFCFLCFSYFFSPLFTYFSSLPACSLSIGLSHYLSTSLSLTYFFFIVCLPAFSHSIFLPFPSHCLYALSTSLSNSHCLSLTFILIASPYLSSVIRLRFDSQQQFYPISQILCA